MLEDNVDYVEFAETGIELIIMTKESKDATKQIYFFHIESPYN